MRQPFHTMKLRRRGQRTNKRNYWILPTLLSFGPYLKPHWRKLLGTLTVVLTVAALQIVAPYLIGKIVDLLAEGKPFSSLFLPFGVFALVLGIRSSFILLRNCLMQQIGMRVACDMRIRLFEHLQKLSLRFYENKHTGKVVSRITDDADALNGLVSVATVNMVGDGIAILGVLLVLLHMNAPLALLSTLLLPLFVVNYIWHRRRLRLESRRHRHNWDRVVGFLHERISNTRVVRAFATEEVEIELFRDRIEKDYQNYNRIVWRHSLLGVGADVVSGLGTLLILIYGAYLVRHGNRFTLGALVAFYSYLPLLYAPIVRIVDSNAIMQRAATAIEKISRVLEARPHVPENHAMPPMPRIHGHIEFESISFGYRQGQHTLRNISFCIQPGQIVALVGPSGAGKSTIAALLARFYDPDTGAVLIDGSDIRIYNVQSLRRQIGIVMQENVLFADTIANNIRYGRPDATDSEVVEAAVAANAHEFICQFDRGYNSQVGERGVTLSGGQRQRIAIARVILKNPRILVLDEATSALDSQSERLVQDAMERLMVGRTSLVIAHRLSTVIKANRILVMQHGEVIDEGTHRELIQRPGLYRELYTLQFQAQPPHLHSMDLVPRHYEPEIAQTEEVNERLA